MKPTKKEKDDKKSEKENEAMKPKKEIEAMKSKKENEKKKSEKEKESRKSEKEKTLGTNQTAAVGTKAGNNRNKASTTATSADPSNTRNCRKEFPMFQSPVAKMSNRLLWGDWEKGEYGLLVRSFDVYDRPIDGLKEVYDLFSFDQIPPLHYLPASYLHASLRTSRAIFEETSDNSFAVLVGRHYAKNTAVLVGNNRTENDTIDCVNYYPGDAGTIARGVLEQPGGTFCRPDRTASLCLNNGKTCLTGNNVADACGKCQIPGTDFGTHVAQWAEMNHETLLRMTFVACWYEELADIVAASNSLWMERRRWFDSDDDSRYGGWTECPATRNIQQKELLDAIVVPLYDMRGTDPSLCDFDNKQNDIAKRLQLAYDRGFGLLPVLFYRETAGMASFKDCQRLWGGVDCNNGREKYFFSQEYGFDNGACVYRPPGLKEAYYFPPNPADATCTAFDKGGTERIEKLRKCESGIECDWDVSKEETASFNEPIEIGKKEELEEKRCVRDFPMFQTPVSQQSNRLLWGEWDKGEYGLLVRSVDVYDRSKNELKEIYKSQGLNLDDIPSFEYLPASYLHASLRAPMGIFVESDTNAFSVIVGKKYAKNTVFEDSMQKSIDCELYYPSDAGTLTRGTLEKPGATFCRGEYTTALCIDNDNDRGSACLTADSESACGQCIVPGASFGDHVARWAEQHNEKLDGMTPSSCWYDKSREGMTEMVAASNSLWLEYSRWMKGSDLDYIGWTECPATKNIQQKELLDAIAIPLTRGAGVALTMCNWNSKHDIFERLQLAYDKGFGLLPVVFYQEVLGMEEEDCARMWGGVACDNGHKKSFFSQEYIFENGACIHRPPGCNETYYFPPNDPSNPESVCSAFSDDIADRVERLRRCESGIECQWDTPKEVTEEKPIAANHNRQDVRLENIKVQECQREFPMLESNAAQTTNELLWGDWEKGARGVLIRSFIPGLFDDGQENLKQIYKELMFDEIPEFHYLPASYLHASMRASRAIFLDEYDDGNMFSLLIGTKYKQNWAMKDFQQEGSVDCQTYYPSDGRIIWQGSLEDPSATLCRPSSSAPLCVNDVCLASNESACGGCQIPGQLFGELVARQSEKDDIKHSGLAFMSCWYPKSLPGMRNMVAAANSAWMERHRWRNSGFSEYSGWTECPATLNIKEKEMIDAIVIPLYIPYNANPSMCNYENQDQIGQRLQLAYDSGYGHLPVLFYKETEATIRLSDCLRFWEGTACNDGYEKEFFSQAFKFDDGACLHRPPGCSETYYFPPLDVADPGAGCSAFSGDSISRIATLVKDESKMATSINIRRSSENSRLGKNLLEVPAASMPSFDGMGWACFVALGVIFLLFVRRTKHQAKAALISQPGRLTL